MEYNHEKAVADGVNVGCDIYRISTAITQGGSKVDAGFFVDKRDRQTRKVRWEQLDEVLAYDATQLDRDVVAPDQIRTVLATFRDKVFTEMFPGRTDLPKTLIFAKDDSHADDIVRLCRLRSGFHRQAGSIHRMATRRTLPLLRVEGIAAAGPVYGQRHQRLHSVCRP